LDKQSQRRERRKWAQDAIGYNALVLSWPDLKRLADEQRSTGPTQGELIRRANIAGRADLWSGRRRWISDNRLVPRLDFRNKN